MSPAALWRAIRGIHPRAFIDALVTYPRFIGTIKPGLLGKGEAELQARLAALAAAWRPCDLDVPIGKTIVVIAPHPDDETIGVGGFLLRHRGHSKLHIINLFNGDGGGQLDGRPWKNDAAYTQELVSRRRAELRQVAARLGISSLNHLGLADGSSGTRADAARLRAMLDALEPDVILLPWFLDGQPDHRITNVLYASANAARECLVLGYEVWSLLQPNAKLDISNELSEKLQLVEIYRTQTATVDYRSFAAGLAQVRAFQQPVRPDRGGAVEAFVALPNRDYCDLVCGLYGTIDKLTQAGQRLAE